MKLGKIKKVPLREIWKHEALDFTNWLAEENNLGLLSESIGVSILNSETEVGVGKFHVDILAEDDNGKKIIIENQLEVTNHDHLGKIITYASGLDAEIVIWIVAQAREEHEQAINWLNENTTEGANFFLIEVEALKIGDSLPAPRFNIVAEPNEWAKTIKQRAGNNKITDLKLKQQEFWAKLKEYGETNSVYVKSWQKPKPRHWYNIAIGSSQANVTATINTRENKVGIELYIRDNKDLFNKLYSKKTSIENSIGKLDWQELPNKKASRIIITKNGDFEDEGKEDNLISWLFETIENFAKVLPSYF